MADLTDLQTAQSVKLAGANPTTGVESNFAQVDSEGNLQSKVVASTATVTSVASSATNVTLLSANSGRKGASFYNDSNQTSAVKFGATASFTSFTLKIPANGYYEMTGPIYTGQIDAIWNVANGNMIVTELTL